MLLRKVENTYIYHMAQKFQEYFKDMLAHVPQNLCMMEK